MQENEDDFTVRDLPFFFLPFFIDGFLCSFSNHGNPLNIPLGFDIGNNTLVPLSVVGSHSKTQH
jgi:hypothetical protein